MTDIRPQDSANAGHSFLLGGMRLSISGLYRLSAFWLRRAAFWVKGLVFVLVCFLLYQQVVAKGLVNQVGQFYGQLPWQSPLLWLAFALMPLNWCLEAFRWQVLARRIEPLAFGDALAGVLVGVSLAFVTPGILGEYAGRTLVLESQARSRSAGSMVLSNSAQFIITLFFGGLGLVWYLQQVPSEIAGLYAEVLSGLSLSVLVLLVVAVGLLLSLYLYAAQVVRFLEMLWIKRSWSVRWQKLIVIASEYSYGELWQVLALSVVRYGIFSIQFVLLLQAMGVGLPWSLTWAGVSLVLLAKTVIPSLSLLGDLGLRELSALVFFSQYGVSGSVVIAASLMIWAVNIFLPAMLGLAMILRIRLWSSTAS